MQHHLVITALGCRRPNCEHHHLRQVCGCGRNIEESVARDAEKQFYAYHAGLPGSCVECHYSDWNTPPLKRRTDF